MRVSHRTIILATTGLLGLACLTVGWWWSIVRLAAAGAIGLGYVVLRSGWAGWRWQLRRRRTLVRLAENVPQPVAKPKARPPIDPSDTEALVEQMRAQGRYALLLRPQIANNLEADQFRAVIDKLSRQMALVPEGEVVLGRIDDALDDGLLEPAEVAQYEGRVVRVEPFFLDRYPVTNAEYYEFVAAGGYSEMSLWDKRMWPAVLELVDRTGEPGPRFWREGCYAEGEENLPVVGVSWFEAAAYARWVGKRLPSDAEWVKSGSWPVPLSDGDRQQRKYPWGATMDRRKANLWGSAPGRIVPVDEFGEGVSVGGVYQLIGNVWEWTASNFNPRHFSSGEYAKGELTLVTPMKSIRGGAFDTYFDNQATCQFQSGENPLGRRHNISFRCCVGAADLLLAQQAPPTNVSESQAAAGTEPAASENETPVAALPDAEPNLPSAEEALA